jgi:polyisoprenyl-teichoic acid--peptidoglycan teichoic acid transferase
MIESIKTLVPGITFDGVALINLAGFSKLVYALKGVDMCIDQRVVSLHYDTKGNYVGDSSGAPRKVYEIGCRHLQPWEALDYVRQRKGLPNGDYDRQRHQQQFLAALFKKLLSKGTLTDPGALLALKDSVGDLLTVDLLGVPVADWVFTMKNIRSNNITMVKTNGGKYASENVGGKSYQVLTPTSLELFQALVNDTVSDFLGQHPTWIAKNK